VRGAIQMRLGSSREPRRSGVNRSAMADNSKKTGVGPPQNVHQDRLATGTAVLWGWLSQNAPFWLLPHKQVVGP
jgi:hypothetical protein